MDKSGAVMMDGIGNTRSSPSFAPIKIIEPHPPEMALPVELKGAKDIIQRLNPPGRIPTYSA